MAQALLSRRISTGQALPLVLLASLLLVVPGLITPAFYGFFVDRVLPSAASGYLGPHARRDGRRGGGHPRR